MREWLCGKAGEGVVGGVVSVAPISGNLVLAFERHGAPSTLVGVSSDDGWRSLRTAWTRELRFSPEDPPSSTWLSPALSGGAVVVVKGIARLLVDATSGKVLAETEAPAVAISPAVASRNEAIVAERTAVHGYDACTLSSIWRRETPGGMVASGISSDLLCNLSSRTQSVADWHDACIWDLATDEVRPIARGAKAPVDAGSLLVIPCGRGSAADRVLAVTKDSFTLVWEHIYKAPAQGPFWTPPHVAHPVVLHAANLIVATDTPGLECRDIPSGRLIWKVELPGQPSAIRLLHGHVWVTTEEARIIAVDPETGSVSSEAANPASELVVSIEDGGPPGTVLVVGGSGSIYAVAMHHES